MLILREDMADLLCHFMIDKYSVLSCWDLLIKSFHKQRPPTDEEALAYAELWRKYLGLKDNMDVGGANRDNRGTAYFSSLFSGDDTNHYDDRWGRIESSNYSI